MNSKKTPDTVRETVPFLRKYVMPTIEVVNPLSGRVDKLDPKNMWDLRTAYAMLPILIKYN